MLFASTHTQAQGQATLMEQLIKDRPVLVELVTAAGLVPVLSGDSPHTLLAPPESALTGLKGESPEKLRRILSGHILKGKYTEKDFKDGAQVKTISGESLHICRKQGHTLINGVRIVQADTELSNGVLHSMSDALKI
ncbi:fasciclin domain-containing protein [Pontibacter ruber]|uniref:Fasciclin domain-containing protein n=1 Tax=Pontibacter ruber TaxID=1343895 RepID=A0ABW5D0B2_9BACT|nr:fasciclin domain-containing protein [Pontibacter ruber]